MRESLLMANAHIIQRVTGIQQALIAVHAAGSSLSSASKGRERQAFIDGFLKDVLPSIYRFGTGDATDKSGQKSGELDVVIEHPFAPSLPMIGGGSSAIRLYPAESIAAVIEIKSDLSNQWMEVLQTAEKLAPLRRDMGDLMWMGPISPTEEIPLFVAGYKGWNTIDTPLKKLAENSAIAGILVIDPGIFVSTAAYRDARYDGPAALWAFISTLHLAVSTMQAASTDPTTYAV